MEYKLILRKSKGYLIGRNQIILRISKDFWDLVTSIDDLLIDTHLLYYY